MNRRAGLQHNETQDDFFLTDDSGVPDNDVLESEREETHTLTHSRCRFNMSLRHRLEEKMEQRRLLSDLGDYDYLDLDDDILH